MRALTAFACLEGRVKKGMVWLKRGVGMEREKTLFSCRGWGQFVAASKRFFRGAENGFMVEPTPLVSTRKAFLDRYISWLPLDHSEEPFKRLRLMLSQSTKQGLMRLRSPPFSCRSTQSKKRVSERTDLTLNVVASPWDSLITCLRKNPSEMSPRSFPASSSPEQTSFPLALSACSRGRNETAVEQTHSHTIPSFTQCFVRYQCFFIKTSLKPKQHARQQQSESVQLCAPYKGSRASRGIA